MFLDKTWLPISKLSSLFTVKKNNVTENVLFLKLYEKGSLALLSPLINEISKISNSELYFVTLDINKDAMIFLPEIKAENIYYIQTKTLISFIRSFFYFTFWSQKKNFSRVFNLDLFSNISKTVMNMSNGDQKYLISDQESLSSVGYDQGKHIYEHYYDLFNKYFKLTRKKPEYANLFNYTKRKQISFYINTKDPLWHRSWTNESWNDLISICKKQYGNEYDIVVLAPELEGNSNLVNLLKDSYKETKQLSDLLVEISQSMVFVTTDCGPSHFAAFCNTRTITLFGPESPDFFGSLSELNTNITSSLACSPCFTQRNKCISLCRDNICMKNIHPELILSHITENLGDLDASA